MLPQRTLAWFIWSAVLLSACSVLFFRCFLSLDGPVHVLHAAAIGDAWLGGRYEAHGLHYDLSRVDVGLFDVLIIGLLRVLSPETTEAVVAAVALFVLCAGAVSYAHALCGEHRPTVLLVLPLSVSMLLVHGFFPFMAAVGVCLWAAGRWHRVPQVNVRVSFAGVLVLALCMLLHRSAVALVLLLAGAHELVLWWRQRHAFALRWSYWPPGMVKALLLALPILVAAYAVWLFAFREVFGEDHAGQPLRDLLHFRVWLLLDAVRERPLLIALALLLLVHVAVAVRARSTVPHAAPLVLGLALLVVPMVVHTPWMEVHYVTERAQFIGVLLVVLWAVAAAPPSWWSWALVAAGLVLHGVRITFLERRMSFYADERASVTTAAGALQPGSLVMAANCSDDWLLLHMTSALAVRHSGLVLVHDGKLPLSRETAQGVILRKASWNRGLMLERSALCLQDPQCNGPDHIVAFGCADDPITGDAPALAAVLATKGTTQQLPHGTWLWTKR